MRTNGATPELASLLNAGTDFVMADCYEFTLNGGSVLRYTGHDQAVQIPARRNDILWSADLSNAVHTKTNLPLTLNAVAAPNGEFTADLVRPDATNAAHAVSETWATSAGATNVYALYLSPFTRKRVKLRLGNTGETAYVEAIFDVLAGTINVAASATGGASAPVATITAMGNGWYRCTIQGITPTVTTIMGKAYFLDDSNTQSWVGDSVHGVYVFGVQGSPSPLTSYAPTTSAASNIAVVSYPLGPTFTRGQTVHEIGTKVATLDVTIAANSSDLINGVPVIAFITGLGLDGATFKLSRIFRPDWSWVAPFLGTGSLIDFSGRITSVRNIGRTSVDLTVSAWTVLLNVNMGPDLFQTTCLNTLFDANCTLNKVSFAVSGTVAAGATTSVFNTNLSQANGYFDQGQIVFTSGPNNGLTRGIKSYVNASGKVTLIVPLPAAPGNGDTFTIYPGDDQTMATCNTKFSNLIHFRGQPFIPPVTSAV